MSKKNNTIESLQEENELLRSQLEEAKDTLSAIQRGEVDALVVSEPKGDKVFTLRTADFAYRLLVEQMSDGAVTFAYDGTILYCNSRFAKMLNVSIEKIIGSQIRDYLFSTDTVIFEELINNVKIGESSTAEILILVNGKKEFPVYLSLNTLQTYDVPALCMLVTDLTERKGLEKEKEKLFREQVAHAEAQNAIIQRDQFVGIASHELKTPVTSIKAYTQLLNVRFRKANDMRSSELVTKMDSQLNKLTSLINDLLDVTKIEGDKLQFHTAYFDINELIEEIVEEVQRTTTKHTIQIKLSRTKSLYGDRDRIGQVITNFITNAIKYSPRSNNIIVNSKITKDKIIVGIADSGIGIPEEKITKVFERFYRVEGEKQDTYAGLGLGLYISSEIIRRHNGRVWVESSEGKGSTFYFSLPLKASDLVQNEVMLS